LRVSQGGYSQNVSRPFFTIIQMVGGLSRKKNIFAIRTNQPQFFCHQVAGMGLGYVLQLEAREEINRFEIFGVHSAKFKNNQILQKKINH